MVKEYISIMSDNKKRSAAIRVKTLVDSKIKGNTTVNTDLIEAERIEGSEILENIQVNTTIEQKKSNWLMERLVDHGLLIFALLVVAAITLFVLEPWKQKFQENEVISKTETGIPVTDADGNVHSVLPSR